MEVIFCAGKIVLKIVCATFLLVCFLRLKESTYIKYVIAKLSKFVGILPQIPF